MSNTTDLEKLNSARDNALAAQDLATQAAIEALNANNATIAEQAEAARRAAQANARLTALGTNEKLAALGLAGNAYAAPVSGFSETSRIANDIAYRNALEAVNRDENRALREIAAQVAQTKAAGEAQKAALSSDWEKYMLEYQMAQDQFARNLALQEAMLTGKYNGQDTLGAKQLMADYLGLYNGQDTLASKSLKFQNDLMAAEKEFYLAQAASQKLQDELSKVYTELEIAKVTGQYKEADTLAKQAQKIQEELYKTQIEQLKAEIVYQNIANQYAEKHETALPSKTIQE